ncbi:MAG: hypothetical protein JWO80_5851, partial [Bryobacterales bacterium]|nr:hypothetical protein [Bryobacterales bacterium]
MCVAGFLVRAQTGSLPTDFYIVSEVVSDASPFWFHYILHVTAAGRDSLVTYIRVAPLDAMCSESISVQAATVTLSGVQPADLISAYHICEIDSPLLNRKLQRRIHTAAIDDSLRFGIVASCEGREVVIHLPFPEQVRLEDLRKKSPQLARWWDLPESIKQRAFGSSDVFHPVSAEQDDRLQEEGGAAIAALRLGRFDQGLGFSCRSVSGPCKPRSFADELRGYVGTLRSQEDAPKLSHAAQYRF